MYSRYRVSIRASKGIFRGKAVVAGFHGIGYVGYLAVRHLVRALKGRLAGYVITPYMPQFVTTATHGVATPYELYDVGPALVFLPNVPLSRGDIARVPYALTEASVAGGASIAVLVGGLDRRFRRGSEKYRYAATRAFLSEHGNLVKDAKPLEEGLYIVGPLATMLACYAAYDFPAVAILPYADPGVADPLAAKVAVEFIARVLDLNVDTTELSKLAEEKARLERELEEIKRKASREGGGVPAFYV